MVQSSPYSLPSCLEHPVFSQFVAQLAARKLTVSCSDDDLLFGSFSFPMSECVSHPERAATKMMLLLLGSNHVSINHSTSGRYIEFDSGGRHITQKSG
jgi:hypothetical protein